MYDNVSFFSAFVIGLLGSFHCFFMCGVFSSLIFFKLKKNYQKNIFIFQIIYNVGRIFSYGVFGFLFSLFWNFFSFNLGMIFIFIFKIVSGFILIFYFFYINNFYSYNFSFFEKMLTFIWNKIFGNIKNIDINSVFKNFFFGIIWGFIPCGLVYTVLLYSFSFSFSFFSNFFLMLCFGLGTFPSMLCSIFFYKKFLCFFFKFYFLKKIFEFFILFFGFYIVVLAFINYGNC